MKLKRLFDWFPQERIRCRRTPAWHGKRVFGSLEPLESRLLLAAGVWTTELDYAPGETAHILGAGFEVAETVKLQVRHADGTLDTGAGHLPWQVTDGGEGDRDGVADGNIQTSWIVGLDDLNSTLQLTAVGLSSGLVAQWRFTDSGAIFTTDVSGEVVNGNVFYATKADVYLNGGGSGATLDPGEYYVQVTDPSGATVLGTSVVTDIGWDQTPIVVGADGKFVELYQLTAILRKDSENSVMGYDDSPNPGREYKVWVSLASTFAQGSNTSTDNFKVRELDVPLPIEPPTSIAGVKFLDVNGDGVRDLDGGDDIPDNGDDEIGLGGWRIFLDEDNDGQLAWTDAGGLNGVWDPGEGEQWTTTAADGTYLFEGVIPSTYTVREEPQDGWVATLGADGYNVTIALGDTLENIDFGNVQAATISGQKFLDLVPDGVLDPDGVDNVLGNTDDEVGIENWQIFLDGDDDGQLDWVDGGALNGVWDPGEGERWTLTDSDGNYQFDNLLPGDYAVHEVLQEGFVPTKGADGYDVSVAAGDEAGGIDFGNAHLGDGNARTKGFWQNKNGRKLFEAREAEALSLLESLNLKNEDGSDFDPDSYGEFRRWLRNSRAVNMQYMLSAQLATMELNVLTGLVDEGAYVFVGTDSLVMSKNEFGFVTVRQLLDEANDALPTGDRAYLTSLKDAIDDANNNLTFSVGL